MKYLIVKLNDDATEDIVRSYAEFLLETAVNDETVTGVPNPFDEHYFVGDVKDLTEAPTS